MRFLLISDTHGKLGIIDELARHVEADAVIHAGDFGFYDTESYERLSERELRLQILHSDLSSIDKDRILALPREERVEVAKKDCPLSELLFYLAGERHFEVPIYAVWGNHEDKDVVEGFFRGDSEVENLHILHHGNAYRVGPALVYGLGGNFLAGSKLTQQPIAGGSGRIWSTLSQYTGLVKTIENEADVPGPRIFVSHVSPGKEPFVELIGVRTRADFTISGHMGAPTSMVWNPFAISSVEEATNRLQNGLEKVREACLAAGRSDKAQVDQAIDFLGRLPEETVHIGRGKKAPRWYRGMTHVNLPDAHVGYAVMDVDQTDVKLQTAVR